MGQRCQTRSASWLLMEAGPRRQRQPEHWCWVLGQAPPSQAHCSESWPPEMLSQGEVTWSPERRSGTEALLDLPLPNLLKILYQNRVLRCGASFWVEFQKQKEYLRLQRAVSALWLTQHQGGPSQTPGNRRRTAKARTLH